MHHMYRMLQRGIALAVIFASPAFAQNGNTVGVVRDDGGTQPGYWLFAPLAANTNTYLMDQQGRVVNQWTSSFRPGNSVYLTPDGGLIRTMDPGVGSIIGGGGAGGVIERRSWTGALEWSFSHITDSYRLHHDVELLPNGNLLCIAWESKSAAEAVAAGRVAGTFGAALWPDKIIEVQPTGSSGGTIVWEWHAWDHLVQFQSPDYPNYGNPSRNPRRIDVNHRTGNASDWMHCNGVDYNAELDQIMITSRSFSEIWIIDHDTTTEEAAGPAGDLLYRWGNPEAYGRGSAADRQFFGQHDAKWIKPGVPGYPGVTVFNNGNGRPGTPYSSIDELMPPILRDGTYGIDLDEPFGPAMFSWSYVAPVPSDFYSSFISGAERQRNGNTLICSGAKGNVFEIDVDGVEVWRYIIPLDEKGSMTQGDIPSSDGGGPGGSGSNKTFRAERYELDFEGFVGKDLTPGATIELYPRDPCPADLNADGKVDGADAGLLLASWGEPGVGDLNEDGVCDGADIGLMLAAWGVCDKP
ncbi:MAG: aryl-sulfate sulfotransferase [Phycisphaerales bacterium]|nr:aryl-sulfate sulfotransferase [Phycisphaerales bacterium]